MHRHDPPGRAARTTALTVALGANAAFAVVELVTGIAFGSLSLLADAAHMMLDVAALVLALVAHRVATRPATGRHTYGFGRAEVLAALTNGLLVLVLVGFLAAEAVDRLRDPAPFRAGPTLAVALGGLAVNLGSAGAIARVRGASLNMRGALVHLLADAGGSLAVMAAAGAAVLWEAYGVDPLATVAIALLLIWAAWGLLRDAVRVLMEGAPPGLEAADVERALAADPDVEGVHHLHLWSVGSEAAALSAHVQLRGEVTLHEAQVRAERLKEMLVGRFGIEHSTLELECHACEPAEAGVSPVPPGASRPADG